jgi:N-acetylglucosamine kinase-like BadF-type ATPase
MEIYVGINGGHQKSAAVALTKDGVLGSVLGESLNMHTFPRQEVAIRFRVLLTGLARHIGLKGLAELRQVTAMLVLSLPGVARTSEQKDAAYCLRVNDWHDESKYKIVDDTWAGLYAGTLSK